MRDEIRVFALQNALEHGGKANMGPVIGKMMAAHPDLKEDPKKLSSEVKAILEEINSLGPNEQKELMEQLGGPNQLRKRERKDPLVPLENVNGGGLRMRFAPGPSGPLHIGHTRAAVLNDEYCRRYEGTFILRLEDTNPERIDPDAYDMIREDLDWLGITVNETYVQSDRFELYYDITRSLIERGAAYVCTMDTEEWRDLKSRGLPCQERVLSPDIQLEKWNRMQEGDYAEGEAFLVVKTDLNHRNPAVRDFVGMRIRYSPHPRTGDRYHLYPLYNLSVAIDDHLMGCTHILRGKDHLNNTIRQKYVFDHMGWRIPWFKHYGLVSIPETLLKTSLIREEIESGNFTGWSDVRLGTVRALAERGFDPDSIRRYWLQVGIKSVDINFSWETLETMNRDIIDELSDRYFFVQDPVVLTIRTDSNLEGKAPIHPDDPSRGYREYRLEPMGGAVKVVVPFKDLENLSQGSVFRLKDLCNVYLDEKEGLIGTYRGRDISALKEERGNIIQWAYEDSPPCTISMPDGTTLQGVVEKGVKAVAEQKGVVQFERVGFCRIIFDGGIKGFFTHK